MITIISIIHLNQFEEAKAIWTRFVSCTNLDQIPYVGFLELESHCMDDDSWWTKRWPWASVLEFSWSKGSIFGSTLTWPRWTAISLGDNYQEMWKSPNWNKQNNKSVAIVEPRRLQYTDILMRGSYLWTTRSPLSHGPIS